MSLALAQIILTRFIHIFLFYMIQATHICKLPVEVLMYIFYWVVSSELDVRSLEMLSEVGELIKFMLE